jgi:two-component system, LytTR family, sensor kinase
LKATNKHVFLGIGILLPVASFIELLSLHLLTNMVWHTALVGAIGNALVFCLAVWSLVLFISAYPTKVSLYAYALALALVVAGLSTYTGWQVVKWLYRLDDSHEIYLTWFNGTLPTRFLMLWLLFSWMATNIALQKNILELKNRFKHQADAALLLKDAELFKLRQQLQPHFLYNSLNSINALILFAPDKAQEMVGKLSDFLRASVKRESEDHLPLSEELAYMEHYLAIESVRFGARLQVAINDEFAGEAKVPPFLLQPLLENAIKFGLYGNTGVVTIAIEISRRNDALCISITNPYASDNNPQQGTGFGLTGVGRRLYLLYGRTDLLETQKQENKFSVTLKIPLHA